MAGVVGNAEAVGWSYGTLANANGGGGMEHMARWCRKDAPTAVASEARRNAIGESALGIGFRRLEVDRTEWSQAAEAGTGGGVALANAAGGSCMEPMA